MQVTFTPSATGPRIGYLKIASNDPNSPQLVPLVNTNLSPTISNFSPAYGQAGSPSSFYIGVYGSNFLPSSTIQVNGVTRATGYYSSSELLFLPTSTDYSTPGNLSVTVTNPAPGGGVSVAVNFPVNAAITPAINQVSPSTFTAGSPNTTMTVYGSNLAPGSLLQWNGANLTTLYGYLSNTGYYLQATVPSTLLASAGSAAVTVYTAAASPTTSNPVSVSIVNPPPPTLSSASTQLVPVNKAGTLTLSGSGFTSSSTVALNGVTVPSTYQSSYSLSVNLPASATQTPGVYTLTVSTQGGTSAGLNLTAYVPIVNNSMIYNPVNGLFYLSVPSSAGAPFGNSIVSVDPLTGSLGTPIPVGSEPNRLALSSDGRYLWVALDGAISVVQVDLQKNLVGKPFPVGGYAVVVSALAALPGSSNSVVVSTYYSGYTTPTGQTLAIYDSGVARSSVISFATYAPFPYALIVNGATSEIYGPGDVLTGSGDPYVTYTYSASGIAVKSSTSSTLNFGANNTDDNVLSGGLLYTSTGQVANAETGAPVGTFYSSGTYAAEGSIAVDTTLGEAFILEGSENAFGGTTGTVSSSAATLAAFNLSTYTPTAAPPISVSIPVYSSNSQYLGPTGSRLTRWGSNGLAYRGTGGFVSLQTSLVQSLASVNADLSVTLVPSGPATTGSTTTYTATVTNNGPSTASAVALDAFIPSSGVQGAVIPSVGTCYTAGTVRCNLGSLASGASAAVSLNVLQTSAGAASMTVQVSAPETDLVPSNNQATSTLNITGGTYNLAPSLSAISPASILSGSADTVITLTGSGFSSSSSVMLNGVSLATSYSSTSTLTAVVPAANLASLGWAAIVVSTPSPGGGTSAPLPLTVFSALNLGANRIIYDPYSQYIMAGIGAGTSSIAANSIVAVNPGSATTNPAVAIGGTPTTLALSSDGQILYALLPSASTGTVARFNMLTQQPDFSVSTFPATGYDVGLRDIAVLPGSENTVAVDEGQNDGFAIYDFNPAAKTATMRGSASTFYPGTCLLFPNASSLYVVDLYVGADYPDQWTVTASGLGNMTYISLQGFDCYKADGPNLYGQGGGVANISGVAPFQLGTFEGLVSATNYGSGIKNFAPDTSLGLAFYSTDSLPNQYSTIFDSLTAFSTQTFMPTSVISLPVSSIEGGTGATVVDVVRWGQDGIAVLSSTGHMYLLRGAAIVPGELLNSVPPAVLTSSSLTSVVHGTGNMNLTLTGSNFQPGVAVLWNGSYRTTTIVDATHVTVAIPASDLGQPGIATMMAINPSAIASASLSFGIN